MITIHHSLPPESLAAAMVRIYAAFEAAGLNFDAMEVKFVKAESAASSFSEEIAKLVLTHFPERPEVFDLKTTPWERANTNAPFWRKLQRRRRR